jgi:hypothetical protein
VKGKGGRYTDDGGGISDDCVTGVVPVGADDEATLLGGLGIDGKKASLVPFGKTVPLVGSVGDPAKRRKREVRQMTSCVNAIWRART